MCIKEWHEAAGESSVSVEFFLFLPNQKWIWIYSVSFSLLRTSIAKNGFVCVETHQSIIACREKMGAKNMIHSFFTVSWSLQSPPPSHIPPLSCSSISVYLCWFSAMHRDRSFISVKHRAAERKKQVKPTLLPLSPSLLNPALKTELNHSSQWAKRKRGGKNLFHAHSDVHLQSIGGRMDGMKKGVNDGEGAVVSLQFLLLPLLLSHFNGCFVSS